MGVSATFAAFCTGARDAELMLQYLTATYLRIPLLFDFFADEMRLRALKCVELQQVLDAALFEPGAWQSEYTKTMPATIPAPNRDHLSTSVGLLFNEIINQPEVVTNFMRSMLEKVILLITRH